jgi:hypothetical protein
MWFGVLTVIMWEMGVNVMNALYAGEFITGLMYMLVITVLYKSFKRAYRKMIAWIDKGYKEKHK